MPKVGQGGEPVAEPTRFSLVIMSPGKIAELNKLLCTNTSIDDYDNLCRLDILECDRY